MEIVVALVVALGLIASRNSQPAASPQATPSARPTQQGSLVENCNGIISPRQITQTWGTPPELNFEDKRKFWSIQTNCGRVVVEVFRDEAPVTANSLRFLTDQNYFDASPCHRLTTSGFFVIQCGDPQGNGRGGAGYKIAEENLPAKGSVNYPAGTVAMANAGQPTTTGSQFFFVYQDTTLAPSYTVVGKVVEGLDIIAKVAAAGTLGDVRDGIPKQSFGILSAEFLSQKP